MNLHHRAYYYFLSFYGFEKKNYLFLPFPFSSLQEQGDIFSFLISLFSLQERGGIYRLEIFITWVLLTRGYTRLI